MGRSTSLTRREALRLLGAGTLSAALDVRRSVARQRRPNIVFILSDNHRWDAWAGGGHPFVRTPNLDRIAGEGLVFANAFCTTPLCSPARASFLTGRYAWQHGVWNNADRGIWRDSNVTYLELLAAEAGYSNAFIGKWHMPSAGLPQLRGVDHFVTFVNQDGQGRYFDCPLIENGREVRSAAPYLTEELTNRAIEFVTAHRDRPFCVYLSHKAVHHPWTAAPQHQGMYADRQVVLPEDANSWTGFTNGEIWGGFERPIENAIRAYMATVTSLDHEIGRLLEALERLGLLDETILIYASDNGFLFGEHKHVELRWPFEEAIRIPFLVRAPGWVGNPGRRAPQMALNIDLAPTLLDIAGVAVPESMQGISLLPALRSGAAPGRRAWLVENHKEFPYNTPSYRGIRTERYLYVEYEGRFEPTLHDVVHDPGQKRNLIGTPEGQVALPQLRQMLSELKAGQRFDA